MPITDWPEGERPREKLLERGPGALSDAELLALFLRTGVRGKTAVDLARELLADLGGLRGLLEAEASELCDTVYAGIIAAWRDRIRTDYGWISRVLVADTILPQAVASQMEADDIHRFDCVLPVVARH